MGRVTRVTYQADGNIIFHTLYSKRLPHEMSIEDLWNIVKTTPSKPNPQKLDHRQTEHPLLIGGQA